MSSIEGAQSVSHLAGKRSADRAWGLMTDGSDADDVGDKKNDDADDAPNTSISIISFVHWLTPYLYPIFDADVSSIWRLKKIFPAGGSSGARLRKCW